MRKLIVMVSVLSTLQVSAQTNYHFSHTVTTKATAAEIWNIWTDVSQWNTWDSGLKSASISGNFEPGSRGKLTPDKGPKARFKVTEAVPEKSCIYATKIPFGWLIVKRTIAHQDSVLSFTHDVRFTGIMKHILGNTLGKRYKRMLPDVMNNVKRIAEAGK